MAKIYSEHTIKTKRFGELKFSSLREKMQGVALLLKKQHPDKHFLIELVKELLETPLQNKDALDTLAPAVLKRIGINLLKFNYLKLEPGKGNFFHKFRLAIHGCMETQREQDKKWEKQTLASFGLTKMSFADLKCQHALLEQARREQLSLEEAKRQQSLIEEANRQRNAANLFVGNLVLKHIPLSALESINRAAENLNQSFLIMKAAMAKPLLDTQSALEKMNSNFKAAFSPLLEQFNLISRTAVEINASLSARIREALNPNVMDSLNRQYEAFRALAASIPEEHFTKYANVPLDIYLENFRNNSVSALETYLEENAADNYEEDTKELNTFLKRLKKTKINLSPQKVIVLLSFIHEAGMQLYEIKSKIEKGELDSTYFSLAILGMVVTFLTLYIVFDRNEPKQ